jgi:hypothetical protein
VGRGNEIDIVAVQSLKFEHDIGEVSATDLPPARLLADRMVLAIDASEVAMGKKNCPGAESA